MTILANLSKLDYYQPADLLRLHRFRVFTVLFVRLVDSKRTSQLLTRRNLHHFYIQVFLTKAEHKCDSTNDIANWVSLYCYDRKSSRLQFTYSWWNFSSLLPGIITSDLDRHTKVETLEYNNFFTDCLYHRQLFFAIQWLNVFFGLSKKLCWTNTYG